ncbi:MAG: hypothetical protein Q9160_004452 [Pyrenula sp. 1 TL-2023]
MDSSNNNGATPPSSSAAESNNAHSSTAAQERYYNNIIIAHAVFACLAWSVLAPLGAIIIRALRSRYTFAIHTTIQLFAVTFFTIALALGIRLSQHLQSFLPIWTDPHILLGLTIFGLALLNPLLGYIHHAIFLDRRRAYNNTSHSHPSSPTTHAAAPPPPGRTLWAHLHLWLGRALIIAGMINGGLGFRLVA